MRNSKGQFVKGSGGGGAKKKKGAKKKGTRKASSKGLEARVSRLEHNEKLLVGVVDGMESRLTRVEDVVGKLTGAMGDRFKVKRKTRRKVKV